MRAIDQLVPWGPQDDDVSIATIHRAVDSGINWIDTAAEYGLGHSERIVGRAVAALPPAERPYIFTKCGMVWDTNDRIAEARPIATAQSVRTECEASLRRLGVDCIDLLQVHWPPAVGNPVEEYWETLLKLRAEGKIRAAGLSNHDVSQLERAEMVGHVDSLQPPFALIDRAPAADVIPWCLKNSTGVIAYSPLHSSLLTGSFSAERGATLPKDDWRVRSPDFTEALPANLALASGVVEVADGLGTTASAVAVAWVLAWAGVSGAIVGGRSPNQLDAWLGAGDLRLTPGMHDRLAGLITQSGAGRGPLRPPDPRLGPASAQITKEG